MPNNNNLNFTDRPFGIISSIGELTFDTNYPSIVPKPGALVFSSLGLVGLDISRQSQQASSFTLRQIVTFSIPALNLQS